MKQSLSLHEKEMENLKHQLENDVKLKEIQQANELFFVAYRSKNNSNRCNKNKFMRKLSWIGINKFMNKSIPKMKESKDTSVGLERQANILVQLIILLC